MRCQVRLTSFCCPKLPSNHPSSLTSGLLHTRPPLTLHLKTFTFFLSALLIPHASAPYNAFGKMTPSYRHFLAFIPYPLLLSTLLSPPHALYPSFILCTTSLSHPPSTDTSDPRYFKKSTSSNGSQISLTYMIIVSKKHS